MAKKKPAAPAFDMALLSQIVQATKQNSFMYVPAVASAPLVALQYVELNNDPAVLAPAGVPTRATALGIATCENSATASAAVANPLAPQTQPASVFTLDVDVPLPSIKRGFGAKAGAPTYPFDNMQVGQSFFVPATPDRDDPAKSLASTVSAATRKYEVAVNNPDGTPKMISVQRAQRDTNGDIVKGADGKMVKVATTINEMKRTREFAIRGRTVGDEKKPNEALADTLARLKVTLSNITADTAVIGARVWRTA